ncbi:MAG: shikimate kinase [Pseudomonadota bacterium]|jgi:shikimate kinase|uniref:shikimate kinase n=1 Tax=Pseudooceanicola nitratireducens TaxID=517719 RepID=UPI002EB62D82|nr:shikimate kinase [Pseudomonadota bacterium]
MGWTLKKTIVMVGMMGAGKTAVGRALAEELGVPFLDTDHEIETAASMTIAEIFDRDGEPFFRARETEVIQRLLDGRPCVLSTGGGAYLADRNRSLISQKGVAVWLNADLELLWSRVKHRNTRPLLKTPDPKGTLTAFYEKRVPIYQQADLEVPASPDISVQDMAARVAQAVAQRPDVLERT